MKNALGKKGFTLVEISVVLGLLGLVLYAFLQLSKVGAKSVSRGAVKVSINSLNETIRNGVDCAQTIAKNNLSPAKDCQLGKYKPLELYDARGARITGAVSPVTKNAPFNPLAQSADGAAPIGEWWVKSYCDATRDSLVVRFARYQSPGVFYADPLLKRPYDWQDSAENPLFGAEDRVLCRGIASGNPGGSNVVTAKFQPAPLGQRNCTSSFDKNGKTYLIAIGAPEYILLIPDSTRIEATVQCPAGKIVMSGGAECGSGASVGNAVAPGHPTGYISSSHPTPDGTGWSATCCVEGFPKGDAVAYAVCMTAR